MELVFDGRSRVYKPPSTSKPVARQVGVLTLQITVPEIEMKLNFMRRGNGILLAENSIIRRCRNWSEPVEREDISDRTNGMIGRITTRLDSGKERCIVRREEYCAAIVQSDEAR